MTFNQVLRRLKSKSNPAAVRGMARFGITAAKAYGWSTPALKKLAHEIGKDHDLAQRLWSTGILEARMLAGLIDEKEKVTEAQSGISMDCIHPARAGSPRMRCGSCAVLPCNED
jgi:3-methyladenine DNA glycosylase AlkD